MKKWFSRLLTLAVAGIIGWFAWNHYFPSETRIICKRLDGFAEKISFPANASTIVRMAGADSTRDYFTTNVVVTLDGIHNRAEYISGRAEVMNIITLARTYLRELDMRFEDPVVQLYADNTRATMDVIGRVIIDDDKRNKVHQLIRITWVKNDSKWRMEKIETLKMLGREEGADYFPARGE